MIYYHLDCLALNGTPISTTIWTEVLRTFYRRHIPITLNEKEISTVILCSKLTSTFPVSRFMKFQSTKKAPVCFMRLMQCLGIPMFFFVAASLAS
jgi:hypothetical protein